MMTTPNATPTPSSWHLRPLEEADRARITALVDAWWGRPMGALIPRPFFRHFRDTSFVVERDGRLCGFLIGFLSQTDAETAYVHAIGVSPNFRGHGLGRLLYGQFATVARQHGRKRVEAITSPANDASVSFHRRLGFRVEMPPEPSSPDARAELVLDLEPDCNGLEKGR